MSRDPGTPSKGYRGLSTIAAVRGNVFCDEVQIDVFIGDADEAPIRLTITPEDPDLHGEPSVAWLDVAAARDIVAALQAAIAQVVKANG